MKLAFQSYRSNDIARLKTDLLYFKAGRSMKASKPSEHSHERLAGLN